MLNLIREDWIKYLTMECWNVQEDMKAEGQQYLTTLSLYYFYSFTGIFLDFSSGSSNGHKNFILSSVDISLCI